MNENFNFGFYNCQSAFLKNELATRAGRFNKSIIVNGAKVYPNPADQLVNLEHTHSSGEGYAFRVINALGHEMLYQELEENEFIYPWDTSSLQQGIYYVFLYKDGLLIEYKLLSVLH